MLRHDDELLDDDYEDEDTLSGRYLTFRLGSVEYGLEICHVLEIIGIQPITRVPDMPDHVRGIINLRGQVIPVMDVRARFGLEPRDYDGRTCIVVVSVDETSVGLVVDAVCEVLSIPDDQVGPPPRVRSGKASMFVKGFGKTADEVKILLDAGRLLNVDIEELASLSTGAPDGVGTHA